MCNLSARDECSGLFGLVCWGVNAHFECSERVLGWFGLVLRSEFSIWFGLVCLVVEKRVLGLVWFGLVCERFGGLERLGSAEEGEGGQIDNLR